MKSLIGGVTGLALLFGLMLFCPSPVRAADLPQDFVYRQPVPLDVYQPVKVEQPAQPLPPAPTVARAWTETELRGLMRSEIAAAMPEIKAAVKDAVREALVAAAPPAPAASACGSTGMVYYSAGACMADSASACAGTAATSACASSAGTSSACGASGASGRTYGPIRTFFRRLRGL
jgi:hypothetical protein